LQEVVVGRLVRTGAIALIVAIVGLMAAAALSAPSPSTGLVPAQIANDWVRWDKSSCKFVIIPRSQRPKSWTAKVSKAPAGALIGFGEQTESNPFAQAVNMSMANATKAAGAGYFAVNYQWPDTAQPIVQAQSLVAKKPSLVVSFNVISATIPSVNALFNKACTPVIQITQAAPNSVLFGASNENAGRVAGQYLARYVQKKGWDPSQVTLVGPTVPGLGAINKRISECAKVFTAALPKATYSEVTMGASVTTGQQAVTDWLTAHPASGHSKYLVSCTIADIWSIAVANAITSAGRDGNAAVIGQGASLDGIKAIRSGGPIVASTWFDAGRYGNYIVPLALDILANKPVPLQIHQKLLVVDKTNAAKFYRGQ
jgi:ABC-type sugar transport system substrate-binding protein